MVPIEVKLVKSRCGDVGTTLKPPVHDPDPSWRFEYDDSFGDEFEFDDSFLFPCPRRCCQTVYHPVIPIDYIPPIAGMFGNELEFDDSFPRTRSDPNTVYPWHLMRIDYIPPIAGMFVPPWLKAFVEEMTDDDKNKNSFLVVVGNLPYETRNPNLLQLFQPFGHVISADVAIAQHTGFSGRFGFADGLSGRFGFVKFATKEAAQSAIETLNGIEYHNFVLRVEWHTPTTTT